MTCLKRSRRDKREGVVGGALCITTDYSGVMVLQLSRREVEGSTTVGLDVTSASGLWRGLGVLGRF